MDDNPGLSLFQAGNINIENALQNQEEAEDLEDQKRRQEEVNNKNLQTHFIANLIYFTDSKSSNKSNGRIQLR